MGSKGMGRRELQSGNGDKKKMIRSKESNKRSEKERREKTERKRTADLNGYTSAGKCHLFPFQNSLTFQDSCEAALPVFHPTESMTALMKSEDDEDDRNHEAYHVLLLCGSPSDPVSLAHICTIRYPNISTPLNDVCG